MFRDAHPLTFFFSEATVQVDPGTITGRAKFQTAGRRASDEEMATARTAPAHHSPPGTAAQLQRSMWESPPLFGSVFLRG